MHPHIFFLTHTTCVAPLFYTQVAWSRSTQLQPKPPHRNIRIYIYIYIYLYIYMYMHPHIFILRTLRVLLLFFIRWSLGRARPNCSPSRHTAIYVSVSISN